jgi:hypothetical protein|tara:strand:+ start:6593 stop:6925 length:333 start_codon:yes stop_codon:yes gene_type:complete
MPYTKKELKENEFWQKLHEQDRVEYEHKLQQAIDLQDVVEVVDEKLGKLPLEKTKPLRNDSGTFLAFENPDTGLNYDRPDQYISVEKLSPQYHSGEIRDKVLDTEIKELV